MILKNIRTMAFTALLASTAMIGAANAEVATIPVDAEVLNAITMDGIVTMDFGTLLALNEAANVSFITLDTADTLSAPTNAGASQIASIAGTPASGAVNVTAGNGINVDISVDNVVNPASATLEEFTLDNFTVLVPGGVEQVIASDGSQTRSFLADGTAQTVTFGARLTTPLAAVQIPDGTYTGEFVVTAAY